MLVSIAVVVFLCAAIGALRKKEVPAETPKFHVFYTWDFAEKRVVYAAGEVTGESSDEVLPYFRRALCGWQRVTASGYSTVEEARIAAIVRQLAHGKEANGRTYRYVGPTPLAPIELAVKASLNQ